MKNLNEKILVRKLEKILKKEFGTNLSFKEFCAGYGVADLVFAPDFSFSKKEAKRVPITNFHALKILCSLDSNLSYSKEDILSLGDSYERSTLLKQFNFLVKTNYLQKVAKDTFKKILPAEDFNPIKKVIAIEVKLTDHKQGLIQAKRYKYFADESYLAILKSAEKNIDFNEFNLQNIGLILFDDNCNRIEIRYPAQSNKHEKKVNLYARELMLERFINFSS